MHVGLFSGSHKRLETTENDWTHWGELPGVILREVRACDRQGQRLTLDDLAALSGEEPPTIHDCAEALRKMALIRVRRNGVVMLGFGDVVGAAG